MTGGPAGVPIAPGGCGVPNDGGATPSIVPLSFEGTGAAAPGFGAPGAPGAAAPGAPLGRGTPPCCGEFIISMVPLNLGAAAPFRLKPHFLQVFELSSFSVPQFGQNTISPPVLPHVRDKKVAGYTACRRVHKFSNGSCPKCRYDFWGASDLAACATGEAGKGRVDARCPRRSGRLPGRCRLRPCTPSGRRFGRLEGCQQNRVGSPWSPAISCGET